MRRWRLYLPLVLFLSLCILLYAGLFLGRTDALPSPLLNKPFPKFSLATVLDENLLVTSQDLLGEPALINIWSTWCTSCLAEHAYLLELKNEGVLIYGVNYNDNQEAAREWLIKKYNPYCFSINDEQNALSIDLGVCGTPETYLIDSKGVIRYKHVGIVNKNIWNNMLKPRYEALL